VAHKGTDSTQIETRVAAITSLLAQGGTRSDAIRYATEQGWGVTTRTVENYLAKARQNIRSDWEIERPQLIAEMLSRLQRYEKEAANSNQYGVSVQAIVTAAKLVQILK
jgi:hypothetical protein